MHTELPRRTPTLGQQWLLAVPLGMIERVLCAVLAVPLAVFGMVGGFSRYAADDFCWAGILRTEGFLNANVHYYTVYSPRYSFTFLVNLTELMGPAIVPFLPASAILLWLAVLTWTFARFGFNLVRACVLAEVFALATLHTAPDLAQSLYWQTGLLTYLLPLILASFLVGWIRTGIQTWWAVLISGLVTFIAGGLSETYLIPQNVAVTLALLAALVFRTRRAHLLAAFGGGVLALLVIVAAPATAGRVNGTPADLWLAISASVATCWFQVVRLVRFFPFAVVLAVGLPALLGGRVFGVAPRWLLIVTAAVLITLPFCYFPSFYAQNGNPPTRSLIVPGAILIGYCMFLGFALGPWVSLRVAEPRRAVALVALAIVPLGIAFTTLPDTFAAAQYASIFDAEDQEIRASADAAADLTVSPLPQNFGENFVSSDRDDWVNQCVARYYGVRSIAATSS